MSGKKYAIHPGYVYSKFDGGEHYVGYRDLISLYRIKSSECIKWDESHTIGWKYDDYIHLFPQSDGNYRLPTEKPQMTERELLRKAAKTDPVARGAYADWLDEHDEPLLASVYRMSAESLWEMKQVLAEAVSPSVPPPPVYGEPFGIFRHPLLGDETTETSGVVYESSVGNNINWLPVTTATRNSYEYAERVLALDRIRGLSQYQPQPNDDHEEASE